VSGWRACSQTESAQKRDSFNHLPRWKLGYAGVNTLIDQFVGVGGIRRDPIVRMGVKTMKKLKIFGLAIILAMGSSAAQAGSDSHRMGMPHAGTPSVGNHGGMHRMGHRTGVGRNWGGRTAGRWNGGYRAPGGWNGYRRPFVGYTLPSYWVSPSYYIGNYGSYGFSRPSTGYGWSRYYNDAVLTDRYGRVQDSVYDVEWDRYDNYDDGAGEDYSGSYGYRDDGYTYQDGADQNGGYEDRGRRRGRNGGVVGGLVGAGVGGLAGGLIAGKGSNTEGVILGGVVGAAAGAAIGSSNDRRYDGYDRPRKIKRSKRSRRNSRDYDDYDYSDRGSRGTYQDRSDGPSRHGSYHRNNGHWDHGDRPSHHQGGQQVYHSAPAYGYGYGGGEVTTIVVQPSAPITTTTTVVTEEVVYAAAARKRVYHRPRKVWKPRPKPRCVCR
jgi:Ni/Co efflux regulator RcnB